MNRSTFYIVILMAMCSCNNSDESFPEIKGENDYIFKCANLNKRSIKITDSLVLQYVIPSFFDTSYTVWKRQYFRDRVSPTVFDSLSVFSNKSYTLLDYNRDFNRLDKNDSVFHLLFSFSSVSTSVNLDSIKNEMSKGMELTWKMTYDFPDSSFIKKKTIQNIEYLIFYNHFSNKKEREQTRVSANAIIGSIQTSISCNCFAADCSQVFKLIEEMLNSISYCNNKTTFTQ